MEEYVDAYCPFCQTDGTVTLFASRTSMYDTLYRCGLCYKVFDETERNIQEAENRRRPIEKEEITVVPQKEGKRPSKVKWLLFSLVIIGFVFYFFPNT